MGAKGDEHAHRLVFGACGKEFADTHQLSVHIDEDTLVILSE